MSVTVDFDPYSPEFVRDPYPTYHRLRQESPTFYDDDWRLTFFTRYEDVTGILRDRRFGRDIRHVLPLSEVDSRTYPTHLPVWYRMIRGSFIDLEPPEHTRIRSHVNRWFTRRRAEAARGAIREMVERTLDRLPDGPADLIRHLATPVPVGTIAGLLGVAPAQHQQLLDWSHAIVRVFDLDVTREEERAAEAATIDFVQHLRDVVDERRSNPGADLITELVHEDDPLGQDDLIATCILVLNAGHEATVHAIGNGLLALARNPEGHQRLRAQPELLPSAVEELLRYDTPLQMFERWVLTDVEWDGVRLAQGSKVGLLFGAANHDPEVFTRPEVLDFDRPPNDHVAFGLGIHRCLGAPLARVELEEVIGAVASRYRRIELTTDEPRRAPSLVFRGVKELFATLVW